MTRNSGRQRRFSTGMSLLEVILALAVLGMSMAAIGRLVHLGSRSAVRSRDMMNGQFLAENKMEEIRAGIVPAEAMGPIPFELYESIDPGESWNYTIMIEPLEDTGLLSVGVYVERQNADQPASYLLISWMIDPEMLQQQSTEEESTESTEATGGATGGTGGGQ